ncbi:exonuclease domain-containing protein [Nannocystis pusilla]|uniref:Exonuclease domain-containing protein n=1 Tax=Nannocystis pusilla TaxID=889268 RepID=A0A9X3EZU0_9BACT|nr:3'-5' exonuclease [Nannocystis pusilla]MCY1012620.1 exonuclease domain-containing protein [Nannocystis pusilla]
MPAAFDRVVVLDFEATCDSSNPPSPQEVIEFPSVLVSLRDREVVDSFSTFVRPVHHPTLSAFCTELTTIRQQDVDGAPVFADVLAAHRAWLEGHGLFDSQGRERFALVTCGDWDLQTMLPVQCAAAGIPIGSLPRAYRRWINIKKIFLDVLKKAKTTGMPAMLQALGLELQGTHHRGIDDCHNIARLALALADRGARFELTGKLAASHYPELPLELQWGDRVDRVFLKSATSPACSASPAGSFAPRSSAPPGPTAPRSKTTTRSPSCPPSRASACSAPVTP